MVVSTFSMNPKGKSQQAARMVKEGKGKYQKEEDGEASGRRRRGRRKKKKEEHTSSTREENRQNSELLRSILLSLSLLHIFSFSYLNSQHPPLSCSFKLSCTIKFTPELLLFKCQQLNLRDQTTYKQFLGS